MRTIMFIYSRIAAIGTSEVTSFCNAYNEHIHLWQVGEYRKWSKVPLITLLLNQAANYFICAANIRISITSTGCNVHKIRFPSTSIATFACRAMAASQTLHLTSSHTHSQNSGLFVFLSHYIIVQDRHYLTITHLWMILYIHNSTIY